METKKRRISEFFGLLKDSEQSAEEWQEIIIVNDITNWKTSFNSAGH